MATLVLQTLASTALVSSDDVAIITALEVLWKPFLVEARAGIPEVRVDIHETKGGWTVDAGTRGQTSYASRWDAIERISSEIFQGAVRNPGDALDVHAAVLAMGPNAMILAGTTGAGKSTLAVRLLLHDPRFAYASDDLAPIIAGGHVQPFPKPLVVKDEELWPALGSKRPEFHPLGRPLGSFQLPFDSFRKPDVRLLRPSYLVLLERRPGSAQMREISPGKATLECARYVASFTATKLALLTEVCSKTRCISLGYEDWGDVIGPLSRLKYEE